MYAGNHRIGVANKNKSTLNCGDTIVADDEDVRSRAAVVHPERAPRGAVRDRRARPARGGALGDERVAGGEQARGGGERAVEDGAVDPVLEQPLLAPHLRDPHPPRHFGAMPLQPLPRALLRPRRRPPRHKLPAAAASRRRRCFLRRCAALLLRLRLSGNHRWRRRLVVGLGRRPCRRRPMVVRSGAAAGSRRLLQLVLRGQPLRAWLRVVGRRHGHAVRPSDTADAVVQLAAG